MKEVKGNIFELMNDATVDSICITTNGIVKSDGTAVMGAGIALEAVKRWPNVASNLGRAINASGNFPFVMGILDKDGSYVNPSRKLISARSYRCLIWSFPTKHNWQDKSDIELIKNSCRMLYDRTKELGLKNILLPAPGTLNGKLDWETEVKPVITNLLDDRFTIVRL